MKNKIELIYDDKDNEETKKEIGYIRLLICILGGACNIKIKRSKYEKQKGKEIN